MGGRGGHFMMFIEVCVCVMWGGYMFIEVCVCGGGGVTLYVYQMVCKFVKLCGGGLLYVYRGVCVGGCYDYDKSSSLYPPYEVRTGDTMV